MNARFVYPGPGERGLKLDGDAGELVLEDGTRFPGVRFGAKREVAGEVVFATGMTGYVESLTDPSYRGQILALTYPLQGNYGVGRDGESLAFESATIQAQALVVASAIQFPSHHSSVRSLGRWLTDHGIPGLRGVDTRELTQRLRERGTQRGWIVAGGLSDVALAQAQKSAHCISEKDVAKLVSVGEPRFYQGGPKTVMLVDSGAKENIVRELLVRGLSVLRIPLTPDLQEHLRRHPVDGIVLGNGPGNPKELPDYISQVRSILDFGRPLLGICLGSQILALAAGGDTYKLPYGHRSQNQPVRDLRTGRCYITSQNHGYAVRTESLLADWVPWFVNLNDGTNEGFYHRNRPIFGVQFHPEGAPGPEDTRWIFDDFKTAIERWSPGALAVA